jgi:glutamate N-acetyltransferase/amino-acid N-acetyltransferase
MKTVAVEIEIGGVPVRIGGMAKGSGMIHPNMATLLSFITTDADITRDALETALRESCADTYNMISVDGDTSTNDTVYVLANGVAGNKRLGAECAEMRIFKDALDYVNKKLAIDIVVDGEGATKLMEVNVSGAKDKDTARVIARSVTSSNLFKAALFGADANWARAMCAMGYSGGEFDTEKVGVVFSSEENGERDEILLMADGAPTGFDEAVAKRLLLRRKIVIDVTLSDGDEKATAWGCDLTYDYVKINGDYRS